MTNFVKISKDNLKSPLPKFQNLNSNCFIAGGAIRDNITNTPISDYDIFGTEHELKVFEQLNFLGQKPLYEIDRLKTYYFEGKYKVQLIFNPVFNSPEECLSNFDFTICQFAYDGSDIICNPESLIHLYEKKLVVYKLNPGFELDSMRRMQKYIQKGFTICNGGLKEFAEAFQKMDKPELDQQTSFYPDGSSRIIRFD